jgi:hypothetical protein
MLLKCNACGSIAAKMTFCFFSYLTPFCLVDKYNNFGEVCRLDLQWIIDRNEDRRKMFLLNAGTYLTTMDQVQGTQWISIYYWFMFSKIQIFRRNIQNSYYISVLSIIFTTSCTENHAQEDNSRRHQDCYVTCMYQQSEQFSTIVFLESVLKAKFRKGVASLIIQCYRQCSHSQKNKENQNKLEINNFVAWNKTNTETTHC